MTTITLDEAATAVKKTFSYLSDEFHKFVDLDRKWVHTDSSEYVMQPHGISVPLDNGDFAVHFRTNRDGTVRQIIFQYSIKSGMYYSIVPRGYIERSVPFGKLDATNIDKLCMQTAKALIAGVIDKGKTLEHWDNGKIITGDAKEAYSRRGDYFRELIPTGIKELRGCLYVMKKELAGAYSQEQAEIAYLLERTADAMIALSIKYENDTDKTILNMI
jgi:hypothetical protein